MKTQVAAVGPHESRDRGSLALMGRELLAEAFARENALAEMNLEAIGRVLEENSDEIRDTDGEMQDSYSRCKDLYCQLLLEAEGAGDHEILVTPIGQWTSGAESIDSATPALPALGHEQQDPEEMTSILELEPEVPYQPTEPPATDAPSLQVAEAPTRFVLAGARAKEAFDVAEWLNGKRHEFPLALQNLDRLISQNLCFAVELECQDRLPTMLREMWPQRRQLIAALLRAKDDDLRWPDAIRAWIESLPHTHPELAFDPHFPTTPALHSLRYLHALENLEDFRPTLLDTGILLLLFGQRLDGPGLALRNPLNVATDAAEVTETSLRLLRLQRLRNIALTPGSNIEVIGEQGRSLRSLAEEDARAVMPLLMRCLN